MSIAELNQTPSAERIHIGIFGKRNAGKSSLINALTGQNLAVVSEIAGTTTDPVSKAMELLPIGPVVITDTAGFDDSGKLGEKRVEKTLKSLYKSDFALVVTDSTAQNDNCYYIISKLENEKIPYVIVKSKSDLLQNIPQDEENTIFVSTETNYNINKLKEIIAKKINSEKKEKSLIEGIISEKELAVLVVPIDKSAPKGRLIMPQQQTIRAILDIGASAVICRDSELSETLKKISEPPKIIITDSQAFGKVSKIVPESTPLTSFSILFARYKGDLNTVVNGAFAIDKLSDGDSVLICEGCTHHRQCEDIGTVKIPNMLRKYSGKNFDFSFTSGGEFPSDLQKYKLIIHCGGCTLNEREMKHRLALAAQNGVPITNYGILIAHLNGILKRSIQPFSL